MPINRYFTSEELSKGKKIVLNEKETHHLIHVTRHHAGDLIHLVNGRNGWAHGVIETIGRKGAEVTIQMVEHRADPIKKLILAQAIPKQNHLDWILEKGTELGVTEFWLFPSHRGTKDTLSPNQMERAEMLVISAMKQCGRLSLPKLIKKPPIEKWGPITDIKWVFGDLRPHQNTLSQIKKPYPLLCVIGPESGLEEKEIQLLEKMGATGVSLHPYTLRTETAAILAVGLMGQLLLNSAQG